MRKAFASLLCAFVLTQPALALDLGVPELAPLPALPSSPVAATTVQVPEMAIPATGLPATADARLETISLAVSPAKGAPAEASAQRASLDRAYDGDFQAPQDAGVLSGDPGSEEPSGLERHHGRTNFRGGLDEPKVPSKERPGKRLPPWLQGAVDKVAAIPKQITIGAAVAVLAVSLVGGLHHHAVQKNKHWQASKSAAESQLVDSARKTLDERTAEAIKDKARARHDRMAQRIAAAQRGKVQKVDDATHDKLAAAKTYAAYDKLVSARAELALNEISKNPKKRVGEELPKTWGAELQSDENAAVAQSFDGFVALRLDKLGAELGREKSADERLSRDIEEFHDKVPMVFGGNMKAEYDKASAELKRFEKDEIGSEQSMLDAKTAAMRGRVGERLYSQDAQFHSRRDRRDRLSALYEKKAGPAAETARKIDSDLSSMISNRHTETAMLALAAMHTNDTESYQDCDGNGHCTTKTRTVDNSGPYRLAAAAAASAARSDAESARDGLQKLRPLIASLHNDPVLQDENLVSSLPSGANAAVDSGSGPLTDWFLPPLFGMVSGMSSASDGEKARDAFKPVLESLDSVAGQVSSRRDGEAQWVEQQVTSDVQSEEAQAKAHSW